MMSVRSAGPVAIVGAGKVGLTLGRILVDNGYAVSAVISRSAKNAKAGAKYLRCRRWATDVSAIPPGTRWVYLTVPHSAIPVVVAALAAQESFPLQGVGVCHASGMLTAAVLAPLSAKGALAFSFHPLQTFPRDFSPDDILPTARDIYYGVDGNPAAIRRAKTFARMVEGHVLLIPPERRELYHAACVVASNHLTTLLSVVEAMQMAVGTPRSKALIPYFPILNATVRNVAGTSPARALSGPIARGGVETVRQHFAAVHNVVPELLPIYAAASRETVRLAREKGSISDEQQQALLQVIQSFEGKR